MAIKKSPADFQVEEILHEDLQRLARPDGAFALYRLKKEGLATPEAVARVARELKIKAGDVAYGGLKDKYASTLQHVTIKLEKPETAPELAKGTGWTIERLGFVPRSMTSADIDRNRFRIMLRDLTETACFDMDEAVRLLALPSKQLRITNYFGDQRFGSARHGKGFIGKHLIKGDFEGALMLAIATESRKDRMDQKNFKRLLRENWGEWKKVFSRLQPCPERRAVERLVNSGGDFRAAFCALPYLLQQLSVYAYQSHLWNATARVLIAEKCAEAGKILSAEDPFGEMLFPEPAAVPDEIANLDLPLFAKKTEAVPPWKSAAEAVLEEEGIKMEELHIAGVRRPFFGEEPRKLFFTTGDFHLAKAEHDETADRKNRKKRAIAFSLPPGSYATVLLRALGQ
jgi:tRNA pseudouridine13 synthase